MPRVENQPADPVRYHRNGAKRHGAAPQRAEVKRSGWAARLRGLRWPRFGNGAAPPPPDLLDEPSGDGLQALTRGTEEWFNQEAAAVEAHALDLARAAASANLPRLEVVYDEVAEEGELAARSRSVFHGWVQRVLTRVQDAIQSSARLAAGQLKAYEQEIGGLENAAAELPVRRHELREAEREQETGQAQLEYRPYITGLHYFALIFLLVLVDWIANVPVFAELLPKDPGSEEAWRLLAARAETMGLFGGIYRVFARALHHIDASLLALGLIIALVWLAHALGESVRRLVTHSTAEYPGAALTIRGQRRQSWLPSAFALGGLVLIVTVLWLSRAQLETITQERLRETDAKIVAVQDELATARAAQDLAQIGAREQELAGLETERRQRLERADYASVIGGMNRPILFLNIVLALTAAIAAYLRTKGTIRGAAVSPRVGALRERVSELMLEAGARRNGMARCDTAIDRHFARLEYLACAQPLTGWEAKAYRLEGVIPRFRSENARLRGVDVANIAAFAQPSRLDLDVQQPPLGTALVPELDQYRALRSSLRQRAEAALARMDDVLSAPHSRSQES